MAERKPSARIIAILSYAAENMLPLITFIALNRLASLRAAIIGVIVIALIDGIRRYFYAIPYQRLVLLATIMTIGFGLIDLFAETPFMLHYEGVISNFLIGAAFFYSTLGKKSVVQTLSEQGKKENFEDRPDLHRFFTIVTLIWASYFMLKGMFYMYLGLTYPLARAVELRATWGTVSLGVMFAATAALGRPLFRMLADKGMLPRPPKGEGN
ncbi:septation protein IspZ [Sphingomonas sp. 37zxx]|uniref:septation protein IspZ n=1 Tax=Sphingomonas sp. 37zxx TaxID=1550073 RepID=UPI00053BDDD4|nr:septation protein IspZ [Sphingomonas sp. 37zxx]